MYAVWLRRRGEQTADCPVIRSLDELVTIIDGIAPGAAFKTSA
jgi:hypothetical protein